MNASASVYKIKQKLHKVPENKLAEIDDFIDFMLMKSEVSGKTTKFEGIWEGLGFEKIKDLESEIRKIRKSSTDSILKRSYNL
ncbi:MAG: hypothetical protein A7315_13960 [Candidatus Altiarchaeales archaeon WOR_SM1_79]|nr:MAG: hypothetical protein A7315_13960 [Candidatus Altiarchaeales archaeon WOR_SM1_79]